MPSSSPAQRRFWQIVEHNPKIRREHGISQETADEWTEADKRKKKKEQVDKAMSPEIQKLLRR